MIVEPLPELLDLIMVLALVAWAGRFLWRRYWPARGSLNGACGRCRKCNH